MSYQPGKMGIAEGIGLVFFLTFTDVFLSIWTITIDRIKTAAWMAPLVDGVCVLSVFFILLYIMKQYPGQDLLEIIELLAGKTVCWLLGLYLATAFFLEGLLQLRQFAENTLLTALPNMDLKVIIIFFVVLIVVSLYLSIEPVARLAYIILPFVFVALLMVVALLTPQYDTLNALPWLGTGVMPIVSEGVTLSGIGLGVLIVPLLATSFQNVKTMAAAVVYGFSLSTFARSSLLLVYIMVFGVMVGREKVLPFYEMTRLININRFMQRLEALFILLWVISGVTAMTINFFAAGYILVRLFKLPTMKPLLIPAAIIAAQLVLLPPDIVTVISLHNKILMFVDTGALFSVPLVLLAAFWVNGRRKKICVSG